MASAYYSFEEALTRLGCTEEQLRELVRTGKLREFRDAGRLSYRTDEVDRLGSPEGMAAAAQDSGEIPLEDSGEIPLAPLEDSDGGGPGLSDSGAVAELGGSDAPIDLGSDSDVLDLAAGSGALKVEDAGSGSGTAGLASADSGLGAGALGLADSGGGSGGLALDDSGGGSGELTLDDSGSGSGVDAISLAEVDKNAIEGMKKDDTVITNIGISVFDDDDLEIAADPMAKTLLTGGDEHLGLDGSGGGSGLLDLTRESDDTSLGAELLEGIDMTGTAETAAQPAAQEAVEPVAEADEVLGGVEAAALAAPIPLTGVPEPASPAFTGLLIAAVVMLGLLGAMNVATTVDAWPAYLSALSERFWLFVGGSLAAGGLCALVGWLIGKQSSGQAWPKRVRAKQKGPAKADKGPAGSEPPGMLGG